MGPQKHTLRAPGVEDKHEAETFSFYTLLWVHNAFELAFSVLPSQRGATDTFPRVTMLLIHTLVAPRSNGPLILMIFIYFQGSYLVIALNSCQNVVSHVLDQILQLCRVSINIFTT